MKGCIGLASLCDGRDLLPVRVWPAKPGLLCGQCRPLALALGAHVVERRVSAQAVAHERRHGSPAWLTRLTGREDASWSVF